MAKFRQYQIADRAWVAETNVAFYRKFHKFDATFATAVNNALDHLDQQVSHKSSTYLIAEIAQNPIGCIFLSAQTPTIGRIRLFFVDTAHQRKGIGRRMLQTVLRQAKANKLKTVQVSTFDCHPEACRLYESFDFKLSKKSPQRAFGQNLNQLDFECALNATRL